MPTLAATSQRHHGPAGEQLLARLRANTATAGALEMSAVPRIQKRGEAAARGTFSIMPRGYARVLGRSAVVAGAKTLRRRGRLRLLLAAPFQI